MAESLVTSLLHDNGSKILLLVLDGLGGLPDAATDRTELETAHTPNLDRWASEGATGLVDPVARGITPGSGPAHLALFGYDPIRENVGRGVLSALGAGLEMTARDVAARVNFATRDGGGRIVDRRAGRISSAEGRRVAELLATRVRVRGVDLTVRAEKEHRAVVVFRGEGLGSAVADTDPQVTGVPARDAEPLADEPEARRTAEVANEFVARAREILKDEPAANDVLLRGFAGWDPPQSFRERFGLRAAAIAMYPMYRGLARFVGMQALPEMPSIEAEFDAIPGALADADFVFVHVKQTDTAGEDGDFARKVKVIEAVDALLPRAEAAGPDLVIVTGDHSTPASMKSHSWHPVPILFRGGTTYPDDTREFGETAARRGALGRFPSREIMPQALAAVGRLARFGA
jgi:2,3-bisphosphoglycerate-independent phosphoglycerate mutase